MTSLRFWTGSMRQGKTTQLLHLAYVQRSAGHGLVVTCGDRSGTGQITSRIGATVQGMCLGPGESPCLFSTPEKPLKWLIVDEAQFLSYGQVGELASMVDYGGVQVDCFGLLTDDYSHLFSGSKRLVELADEVHYLPVPPTCWCGSDAHFQVYVENGEIILGDGTPRIGDANWVVLCRKHILSGELGDQL